MNDVSSRQILIAHGKTYSSYHSSQNWLSPRHHNANVLSCLERVDCSPIKWDSHVLTFSQTLSGNTCCIIYVILSFVKTLTAMQSNLLEMCSIVLRCQSLSWIWFNSAQKNSSRILEVFDLLNISLDIARTRETTFTAGGWKNATSYRVLPTCTKASTLREEGSKMPSHV